MKNKSSSMLYWIVLPSLWVGSFALMAQTNTPGTVSTNIPQIQTNTSGNVPANVYQIQTNNFLPPPVGPTGTGPGFYSGPFMGTSSLAVSSSSQTSYAPTGTTPLGWGSFEVHPHLLYSLTYGNGILSQPGVNSTTFVNTISPGVLFTWHSHWTLDYTPSLTYYSNPAFQDTTSQRVVLMDRTTYGDWSLSLSQSYVNTSEPLVETGTQVAQEAYATALNAAWQINNRWTLQMGLNQNFRFESGQAGLDNLLEWSTSEWMNYQLQPQLGVALGVTAGYDDLSAGSASPFEQVEGRIIFQPGPKLQITVMGGVDDRQFIHPSAPSTANPIFTATARYQVRDGTLLTLTGSRVVSPSLYTDDINEITGVNGALQQRIFGKISLDITGGYSDSTYTSIVPGKTPPGWVLIHENNDLALVRSDTRTYVEFRVSTTFRTCFSGSIFYMLSDNSSSQSNFSYTGHQVGLSLSYRY